MKTVWIINHYAGSMLFEKGGRHYQMARYLKEKGYNPVVFCSNATHHTTEDYFYDTKQLWHEHMAPEIDVPFVFIASRAYKGNGKSRILNMRDFYSNMLKVAGEYVKSNEKPDIIIGSSVHPLACVDGIKLAKKFKCPCISEIRDLWPESIVAYGVAAKSNPIVQQLYKLEKWIYKKSDAVVMTWAGGYDYIKDKGWQNEIPEDKVVHIGNGVDIKSFNENVELYKDDEQYKPKDNKKLFTYTGSISYVNNLKLILDVAEEIKKRNITDIKINIWGEGSERKQLTDEAKERGLDDYLEFKGNAPKECVPAILANSYVTLLHNTSTSLNKYGQSQNKFFEALAIGKPILMTYSVGHSIIKNNNCGIELGEQTPESIADAMEMFSQMPTEEYEKMCNNSKRCALDCDFEKLTDELIEVMNKVSKK